MFKKALENRSAIMGLIVGLVRDPDVAEDLFQDVIVAIAESQRDFESEQEFLAWSWGVARNTVRRHWAATKRLPQAVDPTILEVTADVMMAEPDVDIWHEEKGHLRHCLKKLSDRNRRLFQFRYADNLKGPALAEKAQMGAGSLRNTLLRIRRSLRACIEGRASLADQGGGR
jgi:RNA polymerase sigma-70 factor, ECF subfamily